MTENTFPQTLAAARAGADWAWARLYGELAPALLGYARGRGASDAEDVIGEVFLQVVRDLDRFEGGESAFRGWVFAIAHHRLLDAQRRGARRPVVLLADTDTGLATAPASEDETLARLAEREVRRVIEQLPSDQRDVVLLRVLGDLTVEQTAAVIGKSPGAVKALQRRGLEAVQRSITNEGATVWAVVALNE
jgi:RNA polymerase sigma-70 factor (ECF subfamily)